MGRSEMLRQSKDLTNNLPYLAEIERFSSTSLPMPTSKDEDWKYVSLDHLTTLIHTDISDIDEYKERVASIIESLPYSPDIVFVNGVLFSGDVSGCKIADSSDSKGSFNVFEKACNKQAQTQYIKQIATQSEETLICLSLSIPSLSQTTHAQLRFDVSESATLAISLHHLHVSELGETDDHHLSNLVLSFNLAEASSCEFVQYKSQAESVTFMEKVNVEAHDKSSFNYVSVNLGATLSREDICVSALGSGFDNNLAGVSILGKKDAHFVKTEIHLTIPEVTSRQLFKNIMTDQTVAEYNGLVKVYPDAQKIDSDQLNRNLVLSDAAEAYSRPQLRIFADDVSCTHGSTTGEIEKHELLYLQSRGLSEDVAKTLLIYGFAEEVVDIISKSPLKSFIETGLKNRLLNVS